MRIGGELAGSEEDEQRSKLVVAAAVLELGREPEQLGEWERCALERHLHGVEACWCCRRAKSGLDEERFGASRCLGVGEKEREELELSEIGMRQEA